MAMAKANFGLLMPTTLEKVAPVKELDSFIVAAEKLGYHSLWTLERLLHPNPCLDDLPCLTHAAAITSKIRVGTCVHLLLFRNPVVLAKELATMDYLSNGRIILGASLGGRDWEYQALGLTTQGRVSKFVESIKVIRALWSEPVVNFTGKYFDLKDVKLFPKPVKRRIPIWIGAANEKAIARAGRMGDGYIMTSAGTPELFKKNWEIVTKSGQDAGRDMAQIEPAKLAYTYVSNVPREAHDVLKRWADAQYLTNYDVKVNCIYGTPDDCIAKIRQYLDAGVRTMILGPQTSDVRQIEMLRDKVLSAFS